MESKYFDRLVNTEIPNPNENQRPINDTSLSIGEKIFLGGFFVIGFFVMGGFSLFRCNDNRRNINTSNDDD